MDLKKNYKTYKNEILSFLISFVLTYTINAKWEIIENNVFNNSISGFLYKISCSFTSNNLGDVFVFLGVFYLCNIIVRKMSKINYNTLACSAFFAILYIVSMSHKIYADFSFITKNLYQRCYSFFIIVGLTILFYLIIEGICLFFSVNSAIIDDYTESSFIGKRIFLISFVCILLGWIPWILGSYPASFNDDSVRQLMQYFSLDGTTFTTHHPPLSSYIMGLMVSIGGAVVNVDFGGFLYNLTQSVVGAAVFSYGIKLMRKEFGIRLRYLVLCILFFAITPFWGCFAQWFEKDLLYTEIIVLMNLILLPVVKNKSITIKQSIAIFLSGLFASLLRNNGLYAVVPTLIVLFFYLKRKNEKIMVFSITLCSILFFYLINNVVYSNIGIEKGSVAEALSIPFEQTARCVKYSGENITEEEKEVINSVLNYELLPDYYLPHTSDLVKSTYKGDNSKLPAYFKVWFKMFFKYPKEYISAFICLSKGYFAPIMPDIEPNISWKSNMSDTYIENLKRMGFNDQYFRTFVEFLSVLRMYNYGWPLLRYLCMSGLYTWIIVLCSVMLLKNKKGSVLILFIPSYINVLVCLAAPLSAAIRYQLPAVAIAPELIGVTLYYLRKKNAKK